MGKDSVPVLGNYVGVVVSINVGLNGVVEGAEHVVAFADDGLYSLRGLSECEHLFSEEVGVFW